MSESALISTSLVHDGVYRRGSYEALLGSSFELLDWSGERLAVELVSAEELPGAGECFSLLFRAPEGAPLAQGTYTVEHRAFGEFLLFLVPIGACAGGGAGLEAVINRPEG